MTPQTYSIEELKGAFTSVLAEGEALRAIIFGSYARGEEDEYSDIDLVIIKETGLRFLDRYRDFDGLFRVTAKVQMLVYTPEEFEQMRDSGNPFIEKVIEDGITIYEAQPT